MTVEVGKGVRSVLLVTGSDHEQREKRGMRGEINGKTYNCVWPESMASERMKDNLLSEGSKYSQDTGSA